jgi:glycosyltransferase involved in cell wall biosynthesis
MTKKTLVLTYWGYKESLISNFTIPYLKALHEINPDMPMHLFTLNKKHQVLSEEEIAVANKDLAAFNTQLLCFNFKQFGIKAMLNMFFLVLKLLYFIRKEKITHLHCFCTPGGSIGYLLQIMNPKIVFTIDSYEPHAEAMVESGSWKAGGLAHKLLFFLEKRQTKAADYIISLTEGMRHYAKDKYGVSIDQFYVKPSCIDVSKFDNPAFIKHPKFVEKLKIENKIVGLYAGKFGGLYLEDETFDLIRTAFQYWGSEFHMIILGNTSIEYLTQKCKAYAIPMNQITTAFVSEEELPYYLGLADFALTPVKPIPSKRYCSPIKNGEYWVLGLPVLITPNISDDSDLIQKENIGYIVDPAMPISYQESIKWLDYFLKNPAIKEEKRRIRQFGIDQRSMERAKTIYRQIYG